MDECDARRECWLDPACPFAVQHMCATFGAGRVTDSGLMVWLQAAESVIPSEENTEHG